MCVYLVAVCLNRLLQFQTHSVTTTKIPVQNAEEKDGMTSLKELLHVRKILQRRLRLSNSGSKPAK